MKTITLFALLLAAAPARAGQSEAEALSFRFAACLGQYSALVFHDHLMRRDATRSDSRRRAFAALYDATAHLDPVRLMAHRIDAKTQFAALLNRATFHTDPHEARLAAQLVRRHLHACETLTLG